MRLSERENWRHHFQTVKRQIALQIALGRRNQAVRRRVKVSTVKTHLHHLYEKLGLVRGNKRVRLARLVWDGQLLQNDRARGKEGRWPRSTV